MVAQDAPCIDVTLIRAYAGEQSDVVVIYDLHNRCVVDTPYDLARVPLVGKANQVETPLVPSDPHAYTFAAGSTVRVAVHYPSPSLSSVCIATHCVAVEPSMPALNPRAEMHLNFESLQTRHLGLFGRNIGTFSADALGPRIGAVTIGGRAALHPRPWLYVGFDIAIGGGTVPVRVLRESPLVTTEAGAIHMHLGGVVGVTSPRLGPFDVRADVMLGGRMYFLSVAERYNCQRDNCEGLSGKAWMVQPRGTLEAWVSPYVTFGAFGGADLVHPGDWSTGLFVGFHANANDRGP